MKGQVFKRAGMFFKNCYSVSLVLFALFLFASCGKGNDYTDTDTDISNKKPFGLFIYMAVDNSLSIKSKSTIDEHLEDIVKGVQNSDNPGPVFCLVDRLDTITSQPTILYKITKEKGKEIEQNYLDNKNTADPKFLVESFNDAYNAEPCENYGLILWGHGSGWLPYSLVSNKPGVFGSDYTYDKDIMSMEEMKEAFLQIGTDIGHKKIGFVWFDACIMASVELYYELRDCTPYFIAPPTNNWDDAFSYDKIIPHLWDVPNNPTSSLINAAEACFSYNPNVYVSLSIVATAGLESLAQTIKDAKIDISSVKRTNSNILEMEGGGVPVYDFYNAYKLASHKTEQWETILREKVIVWEKHTDKWHEDTEYEDKDGQKTPYRDLNLTKGCCGLTTYLMYSSEQDNVNNKKNNDNDYLNTEWYRDTHVE